jgi:hypothetical protein
VYQLRASIWKDSYSHFISKKVMWQRIIIGPTTSLLLITPLLTNFVLDRNQASTQSPKFR